MGDKFAIFFMSISVECTRRLKTTIEGSGENLLISGLFPTLDFLSTFKVSSRLSYSE